MPPKPSAKQRYDRQRAAKTPPHVSLGMVRLVAGIKINDLIERIAENTGKRYTVGAISAVENGHRGASIELLRALEGAYGLPEGAISTQYEPRRASDLNDVVPV
jgi:transcriptional regulator with XRE-family HTH domain